MENFVAMQGVSIYGSMWPCIHHILTRESVNRSPDLNEISFRKMEMVI